MNIAAMKACMVALLCVVTISTQAQIDEDRMERDLEISKGILATLLKDENNRGMTEHSVTADYVEGFGVVFTIPARGMGFIFDFPHKITVSPAPSFSSDVIVDSRVDVNVTGDVEEVEEIEEHFEEEVDEQWNDRNTRNENNTKNKGGNKTVRKYAYSYEKASDEAGNSEEREKKLQEAFSLFLAEYADLIGQLKPADKIVVKNKTGHENFTFISWSDAAGGMKTESDRSTGMSVAALKKDITAYKSGKISREEFDKLLVIEKDKKNERIADLDIFGNIFRQYFSPEYSKSFFTRSNPSYERLKGMGAIFQVRTYSSFQENDMYYLPSTGSKMSGEERKEKVDALYPQFIKDLKSFLVDYGRTIRSLEPEEKVVMKIELTRCEHCSIPKAVEATIPVSLLQNYDQQKISREKAIDGIVVKEIK